MGIGGFLLAQLSKAQLSPSNLKALTNFLVSNLLGGKTMEISINYTKDGQEYELKFTARSEEELKNALEQAENFINEFKG